MNQQTKSPWGILNGIRPAKIATKLLQSGASKEEVLAHFTDICHASPEKAALAYEIATHELKAQNAMYDDGLSIYIGIPFCPTRCLYCSFVTCGTRQAAKLIPDYVEALKQEIDYVGKLVAKNNRRIETVYIGGGTPTTLSAEQLNAMIAQIEASMDLSHIKEFTVEAGRPDTITAEKLAVIKQCGATRISINPQTLNDDVLKAIGRNHTSQQTVDAFNLARSMGFDNINMDLIAGLPCDTVESFAKTLDGIIALDPESVTVHALSMKRASTLNAHGDFPELEAGRTAAIMVDTARKTLTERGVLPYYMYRQSKTVGNLENVGYAKKGFEGLYNVYIMDETHTILACGASAVTKLKSYDTGDISRIFNFKYPYEYISRFDEQILRKEGIGEFYDKHFGAYKQ